MLVGIIEELTTQDVLAKHLNTERTDCEKKNTGATLAPEFYTAPELEVAVDAVTTKVLKKAAYRDQVKYLRRTKKTFDMSVEEFWMWQEFIFSTLTYFGPESKAIGPKTRNEDFLLNKIYQKSSWPNSKTKTSKATSSTVIQRTNRTSRT